MHFEIVNSQLVLQVYEKHEVELLKSLSKTVGSYVVDLKGRHRNIDDFNDDGDLTILTKVWVQEENDGLRFWVQTGR